MRRSIILFIISVFFTSNALAGDRKIEVAGTIRNVSANEWIVINDKTHSSINIESVKVINGVVIITFPFDAKVIHTFVVTLDDSLAMAGYFTGASVRTDSASILISKIEEGNVQLVDANNLEESYSNIWIYGVFTVFE